MKRNEKDDELTRIEYLGQRLASQKPELRDYALNLNADKIVAIDMLLKIINNEKQRKILEIIRGILLAQGEALYIKNSDIFTNLCIKVGSTIRRVSFSKEEEDNGS
ncbi:MAG: hypothetical protein NZ942_02735 [Candidatus Aenigmarchaeota archaeon]|nr:hypothetical protein [Candidatus Aenigmarchaeota archaeon]